jgi:hypothetical protein
MGEEILFKVANGKLQEILGFVVLPVKKDACIKACKCLDNCPRPFKNE